MIIVLIIICITGLFAIKFEIDWLVNICLTIVITLSIIQFVLFVKEQLHIIAQ
jgi:hypothetical protein